MGASEAELLELLDLQGSGPGIFIGAPERAARTRVFGGHLLAQALAAACFTADGRPCHSLHAYFLRPGKPGRPVEYEVLAMRDGQSFAARKVVAVQRDEPTLELVASFTQSHAGASQRSPDRGVLEPQMQPVMPKVPPPESFPQEDERIERMLAGAPTELHERLRRKGPMEVIRIDPPAFGPGAPSRAPTRSWMRARGRLQDDPNLHCCALAYASDLGAIEPSVRAAGASFTDPALQIASLDHALWFHRPFRCDEWLLFVFECVSVADGRGLNRGAVYRRDRALVASIAQEGVIRPRGEP